MNCNQIRELLPEIMAAGMDASKRWSRRSKNTLHPVRAVRLICASLQKTMALLDEWQAPEPSPYFDTRLQARLSEERREEMAHPSVAWLSWLRRPAWAMSLAAVIFAGALLVGSKSYISQTEAIATKPPSLGLPVQPGTAVGDLQALDRNDDLYADFDVLDELQVQDDVTANP